ncbi:MAG: Gfo/Idh/MocA family oxidoreductase [Spirochaetes bacterium]|nr:Gfo/Idh/MocA family oxidoreductase [Spirochaetota bacterium]
MKKAGIGLIGTGFMGRAHSICYSMDDRVELTAVSSLEEDSGRKFIDEFGYKRFSKDWESLIKDEAIDIIDITAPNFMHAEVAIAASKAGKAVIMEKPLAVSIKEAGKVMETVRKNNTLAMYAENRRFAPVFDRCRKIIDEGEIGAVKLFRINELGSGPGHSGWYWDIKKAGGGALIDMGIHGLGLVEWLLGSLIVKVSAMRTPLKGTEETVITSAAFESGTLGQFVCSWGIQGGLDIRAEIYGSKGTLLVDHSRNVNGLHLYRNESVMDNGNRPHQSSASGWSYPPVDEWNVKGHRNEIRHFIDCFLEGITCRSTFEAGYRALQLAEAIYKSAAEGREIEV